MLTKKRGQIKAAVTKMVQECAKWIFEGTIASKDEELKLIETLRTVTAGKIYVEVERARLTHKLAKMQEHDGQIAKAAATMHELQVRGYSNNMWHLTGVDRVSEELFLHFKPLIISLILGQVIEQRVNFGPPT